MEIETMQWEKKGIVFNPQGKLDWANHSALQPTPIVLEDRIRIFCGFRDENGISRVGWVDLDKNDPTIVIDFSNQPALDVGLPGSFDDNGVVPTAIVKRKEGLFLYYAGYQIVEKVRFIAFLGLGISTDNGRTFRRYSNVPVMDRTDKEFLFRVVHSIIYDEGKWKAWYGGGSYFIQGEKKTLPVYDIRYLESADGIHFPKEGNIVIKNSGDEYRVGRPYVVKNANGYEMFFGASSPTKVFRLGYATSKDGINWNRNDEALGIEYDQQGFDSEMSSYPSVVDLNDKRYLFYNGNNYGYHGFGLAILKNTND